MGSACPSWSLYVKDGDRRGGSAGTEDSCKMRRTEDEGCVSWVWRHEFQARVCGAQRICIPQRTELPCHRCRNRLHEVVSSPGTHQKVIIPPSSHPPSSLPPLRLPTECLFREFVYSMRLKRYQRLSSVSQMPGMQHPHTEPHPCPFFCFILLL